MKALIAGGGIGGLTIALMPHEIGIEAEIHEQASVLRQRSVSINLLPHTIKELTRLGLMERPDAETPEGFDDIDHFANSRSERRSCAATLP